MTIRQFFSRAHRLDSSFLLEHLKGARSYKRIAGYFTSSLFEVANELLEAIPEFKIVCNVDIHPDDLKVAQLRESDLRYTTTMQPSEKDLRDCSDVLSRRDFAQLMSTGWGASR